MIFIKVGDLINRVVREQDRDQCSIILVSEDIFELTINSTAITRDEKACKRATYLIDTHPLNNLRRSLLLHFITSFDRWFYIRVVHSIVYSGRLHHDRH